MMGEMFHLFITSLPSNCLWLSVCLSVLRCLSSSLSFPLSPHALTRSLTHSTSLSHLSRLIFHAVLSHTASVSAVTKRPSRCRCNARASGLLLYYLLHCYEGVKPTCVLFHHRSEKCIVPYTTLHLFHSFCYWILCRCR